MHWRRFEEERIVRHVEEVLAVVVDDVDALVGGLCECLRRFHVRLRPLVVSIGDALHAVLVHKEIVYLCHICYIKKAVRGRPCPFKKEWRSLIICCKGTSFIQYFQIFCKLFRGLYLFYVLMVLL